MLLTTNSKYLLDPRPPVVDNVINDFAADPNENFGERMEDHPHND